MRYNIKKDFGDWNSPNNYEKLFKEVWKIFISFSLVSKVSRFSAQKCKIKLKAGKQESKINVSLTVNFNYKKEALMSGRYLLISKLFCFPCVMKGKSQFSVLISMVNTAPMESRKTRNDWFFHTIFELFPSTFLINKKTKEKWWQTPFLIPMTPFKSLWSAMTRTYLFCGKINTWI